MSRASEKAITALLDVLIFTETLTGDDEESSSDSSSEEDLSPSDMDDDENPSTANLTTFKPMLSVCNRPLIWYVIAPLADAGLRYFFICEKVLNPLLKSYLETQFPFLYFAFIQSKSNKEAIANYLILKKKLYSHKADETLTEDGCSIAAPPLGAGGRGSSAGLTGASSYGAKDTLSEEREFMVALERDCLLVSCDTILAGVDLVGFANRFYHSLASVSALFFKPNKALEAAAASRADSSADGAAGGKGKGGKGKGGGQKGKAEFEPKPYKYNYCSVIYDDEDAAAKMATGAEQLSSLEQMTDGTLDWGSGGTGNSMIQRRLYYMNPDIDTDITLSMEFASRRPSLVCASDLVDAGVYLARSWVLRYIESCDQLSHSTSLQKLILAPHMIMRCQHTKVNASEGVCETPDRKLGYPIPLHWMFARHEGGSVEYLNGASGLTLPAKADSLRFFITILEEHPDRPCRVYRVNSLHNYKSVCFEMLLRKCFKEGLLPSQNKAGAIEDSNKSRNKPQQSLPPPLRKDDELAPPQSTFATSLLLPEDPFTVDEKRDGGLRMCVVGSLIASVPSLNSYVTFSIVGSGVRIGKGARIRYSVILDNAEIGENAEVVNSVVGSQAEVAANVKVHNSSIGSWCRVEEDKTDELVRNKEEVIEEEII